MYVSRIEKLLSKYSPIPLCVINAEGKVSRANSKIGDVFIYDGITEADVYALTGIKHSHIIEATEKEEPLTISRSGKKFKIQTSFIGVGETASIVMYFIDVTNYEALKTLHNRERLCMAIVNVDNFDGLVATTGEEARIIVSSEIDKTIRHWAIKMEASVTRLKNHLYFLVFSYCQYTKLIESKVAILDDVRGIETEADFPVTLSIGIGVGGKTPAQTEQYAADSLDLALGRGGDQAVVKDIRKIEYYGGKTQAVEKGNKGKSRIIAHALKQLMEQSSKVIIMGHKNPDMDCFGSALGVYRIAETVKKDAYVVINNYNEALTIIYEAAVETEEYQFISSEKAIAMADENTLLIILDTHRPELVESPELLEIAPRLVVIDHHRRAENAIDNQILSYMEPYASSTAELVTEIVQYSDEKKILTKFEAEALLAGITVDTNRFAVKTGVRTFEAASWLRRCGADTTSVKRYFQADLESFKIRSKCVANAQFIEGNIAISICPGENVNAQIVNSQVADELLSVKGIRATFVVGKNEEGDTVVSARSLGEVNVQLIMEKFGGGGHLNTAGARVSTTPEETIEQLKEILKEVL
ncbi:MAG: DHH family phosphoesterase [Anaerovoracaceae bacterium]